MISTLYHAIIDWIGDGTGLPDTILHIHAGMALLVIARLVSRQSLATFRALAFVAACEAGNEIMDRLHFGSWRWRDTMGDVANTMFWPTAICLAVRFRPLLAARRAGSAATTGLAVGTEDTQPLRMKP